MNYFNNELKNIITSTRATTFRNGFILEAKFGKIVAEFPNFLCPPYVNLHVQKISGDGNFLVNSNKYTTISKILEIINLPFSHRMEISRNNQTLGEICVIGFSIDSIEEETDMITNWKALITRCGEYRGLKLVGNKLLATEGAFFERGDLIESIETNPPNAYQKINDRIKFNTGAEVVQLKLAQEAKGIHIMKDIPFQHRETSTPNLLSPNQLPASISIEPIVLPKTNFVEKKNSFNFNELIIFDSKISNLNDNYSNNRKLAKFIKSNGQSFVAIKTGGIISIPLSNLKPKNKYILILTAKKISGNGKLSVGFNSGSSIFYTNFVIESIFYDRSISLNCVDRIYPTDSINLNISMLEDSSGEVLVQRILLLEDLPTISRQQLFNSFIPTAPLRIDSNYSTELDVKELTKKSAIVTAEVSNYQLELNCIVKSTTFSGRQWISKICPFVKGMTVNDSTGQIENVVKENKIANLTICKLGQLQSCPRLFLEEFNPKISIHRDDIAVMRNCDQIVSPSRANAIFLKDLLNKEIEVLVKPWFSPKLTQIKNNYLIYLEKDQRITRFLIDFWNESYPKLIIIGSNLTCPFFIRKISGYLPFTDLVKLLNNSKALLDFNLLDYQSGVLDLADSLGIPIITNNSLYVSDKNKFVSLSEVNKFIKLDEDNLLSILSQDLPSQDSSFSIEEFKSKLVKLLGI